MAAVLDADFTQYGGVDGPYQVYAFRRQRAAVVEDRLCRADRNDVFFTPLFPADLPRVLQ